MLTVQNEGKDTYRQAFEIPQNNNCEVKEHVEEPVVLSAGKNFYDALLTDAINDLSPEMLKKLGIYIIYGTMMKISITQIASLWKRHLGKMFEVVEMLERVIKEIVEDMQHGLLVKIIPDAFIC